MFSHVVIGSNDLARSKTFYDALFMATDAEPGNTDAIARLVYAHRGSRFVITKPIDGEVATAATFLSLREGLASLFDLEALR